MKIQAKDTGFYYYILTYMLLRSTLTTNGSGNGFGSLLRTILVLDLPLGSQWMEKKKRKKRYKYSPRSAVSCLWLLEGRSYPHNSSQGTGVYSSHCRYKYSLGKGAPLSYLRMVKHDCQSCTVYYVYTQVFLPVWICLHNLFVVALH